MCGRRTSGDAASTEDAGGIDDARLRLCGAMAGAEEAGRLLHWVVQVSNLRESLRFYELVFGLRVLRHEEFESGSEAEGGGPYGGASWVAIAMTCGLGRHNEHSTKYSS